MLASAALAFAGGDLALKLAFQAELDTVAAKHPSLALSLGWTSADTSFGLSAGKVTIPGKPERATTPTDKFLLGSGTKPATAVAVLRLMESGALSLSDPVAKHVDAVLQAVNGTTVAGLFGAEAAAQVTVGHLISMRSGLPDFDTPELDAAILEDTTADWPPYAILHVAAAQRPQLHFTPGTMVEYSSTNFVMAGLVLLAHSPKAAGDWKKLDVFSLVFPPALRADFADVRFLNDGPISSAATVPGASLFIKPKTTTIWAQRGGILGWTCGNMAAACRSRGLEPSPSRGKPRSRCCCCSHGRAPSRDSRHTTSPSSTARSSWTRRCSRRAASR